MANYDQIVDITTLQKKLYQNDRSFNNFKDITPEKLEEIREKVTAFLKRIIYTSNLDKYTRILLYLTNPKIHLDLPTYDEKIAFLLEAIDPEMKIYRDFIATPVTRSNTDIDDEENTTLLELRQKEIKAIQNRIRQLHGFYDGKILKYESIYFYKVLKISDLITDVRQDYTSRLLRYLELLPSLQDYPEEKLKEIREKVIFYQTETGWNRNPNAVAFNALNSNSVLALSGIAEKLIFFIEVVDPNLDLLRIFEEESLYPIFKKRALEEVGYCSDELLKLEKKYHQAFCPDKKLSIWSI